MCTIMGPKLPFPPVQSGCLSDSGEPEEITLILESPT